MAPTSKLAWTNLFSCKGYIALVTGGATGIGLMCAQGLAANGAKVYITGRREEMLDNAVKNHSPEGEGSIISAGSCDVTSKESLEALIRSLSEKEKHLNLLVTNAGISGPNADPKESSAEELKSNLWSKETFEDWSAVYSTNVSAVYFTTIACLPLLQAATKNSPQHSASVIIISSISGSSATAQGHFSYNTAKSATTQLTHLMSNEFLKTRIRVNCIAPGVFPSEMTTQKSDEANKSAIPDEDIKKMGMIPAGRAGADEEMAMAVLFLGKNMYVNGEVVAVDGGALLQFPTR